MEGYKTCTKCSEAKPVSEFHKCRTRKDGFEPRCKECRRADYEANAERIAAKNRAWREANPEKVAAKKEKVAANNRAYYQANREKVNAHQRAYQRANREKVNAQVRRRRCRKEGNGVYKILDKELKRLYASPCVVCGATQNIQRDHIIPIQVGGQDSIGNSQPLCGPCNASKKDKLPIEWRVWRDKLAGPSVGAA